MINTEQIKIERKKDKVCYDRRGKSIIRCTILLVFVHFYLFNIDLIFQYEKVHNGHLNKVDGGYKYA